MIRNLLFSIKNVHRCAVRGEKVRSERKRERQRERQRERERERERERVREKRKRERDFASHFLP